MAVTSRFTPNSFFFTDPSAITQSAAQAFGPVSDNVYRLTSKFSLTGDTDAFAVCTGVALVQPQAGNANLVNLILRPFKQPITGFNIKYFVYRGLNIGDFFDGQNVIPAGADASDFINKVNASFTAYYSSIGSTPPTFLASFIGFDPANQPATTLISDLFFKVTGATETPQTAFELPLIAAGASLGTFATGECGFDIVLDYGDYKLPTPNDQFVFDLNYARTAEATIDITTVTDNFQKKLLKEQLFQFLDAAAYYGFHVGNGTVNLNNDGTTQPKTGLDIYNSVLQNFNTKNNLYLYIQSDRTRSYNFYGNYNISDTDSNCLLTGFSATALTERTYDTNGWPVIIVNTTQATSDANIVLYIQFVTDNNDNTVLYGQVAQLLNAQGNNFSGPDDLQQAPDDSGNQPSLSKIFQLSNPAIGNISSKSIVGTFNILIYQGVQINYFINLSDSDAIQVASNFLDDIFDNLNASAVLTSTDSSVNFSVISSQRTKLINHFYNNTQSGVIAVQTNNIFDTLDTGLPDSSTISRISYVADCFDLFTEITSVTAPLTNDTSCSSPQLNSVTSENTFTLPLPYYYSTQQFTDNSVSVNGVRLLTQDNSTPNKVIVGLTIAENATLLGLVVSGTSNLRLILIDMSYNHNGFVAPEGMSFQKYKAGIAAESNAGNLQLILPTTDIIIYSLDGSYLFTQQYSQYMTNPQLSTVFIPVNNVVQ